VSGENPGRKSHENFQNISMIAPNFNNLKSPVPVNLKRRQNSKTSGIHSQSRLSSNLEEGKNAEHSSDGDDVTLNAIIVSREGEFDDVTNARCDKNSNSISTSNSVGKSLVSTKEREKDKDDESNQEQRDIEGGKAGVSCSKPSSNGREGGTVRSFFGYFRGGKKRGGDGLGSDGGEGESNSDTITSSIMNYPCVEKEDARSEIKDVASPSPLPVPSSPIAIAPVLEHTIISKKDLSEVIMCSKKSCNIIWTKILKRCNRNTSTFCVASARQFRVFNRSIG
jgi:hypothetical protein